MFFVTLTSVTRVFIKKNQKYYVFIEFNNILTCKKLNSSFSPFSDINFFFYFFNHFPRRHYAILIFYIYKNEV